ncbi:hypothetical protein RJE46_14335 [Cedecea neteri]|uniref:hypothetical protein n=1 Tax=Cedecea neteri TaxID=158822 RepID=UPI002892F823|nr:hypothetical protein [Cedecea neteri]WNJ77811.1 hypothetical protein RJE46_14335 [Cedecea neteri]
MTLLEILVKELPERGGWPSENIRVLVQGRTGHIYRAGGLALFFCERADDWELAEVTREQYEAALSASKKPEWNGEGLPPVGSNVEVKSPKHGWIVATVTAVTDNWLVAKYSNGVEFAGCHRFLEGGVFVEYLEIFRPIRSEVAKKRDEAVAAMRESLGHASGLIEVMNIYQAIAAGKIPGIRIE